MDIFPADWRRLVKAHIGHMVGYLYFQNDMDPDLESRGIPLKPPLETIGALVWRKDRKLTQAAQLFLDELRAVIDGENNGEYIQTGSYDQSS